MIIVISFQIVEQIYHQIDVMLYLNDVLQFYIPSKMDRLTISPTICVMPCWKFPPVDPGASHPPRTNVQGQSAKYIGLIGNWPFPSNIARPLNVAVAGAEAAGSGNLQWFTNDFQVQGMVKRWPKEWSTPLSDKGSWWEVVKYWSLWHVDDHHLILYETTGVETSQEKFHHRLQEDNTGTAKCNMKVYRKSVKCPVVLLKHNNLDNQPDFTLIV